MSWQKVTIYYSFTTVSQWCLRTEIYSWIAMPLTVKDLTDLITAAITILFLTCAGCCWAWNVLWGLLILSSKCPVLQGAPVVQWLSLWRFWMIFFEILYDILRILWGWTGFQSLGLDWISKLRLGLDFVCYGFDWISYATAWTGLHMFEIGLDFICLRLDWISLPW
jgi:hypothetical protein